MIENNKAYDYVFQGVSSEGKYRFKAEKDLEAAMFGKTPFDKVREDAMDASMSKRKKQNIVFKNILLDLSVPEDSALFNDLLNKKKFNIVKYSESWTKDGEFKVFVIYQENLDIKGDEVQDAK